MAPTLTQQSAGPHSLRRAANTAPPALQNLIRFAADGGDVWEAEAGPLGGPGAHPGAAAQLALGPRSDGFVALRRFVARDARLGGSSTEPLAPPGDRPRTEREMRLLWQVDARMHGPRIGAQLWRSDGEFVLTEPLPTASLTGLRPPEVPWSLEGQAHLVQLLDALGRQLAPLHAQGQAHLAIAPAHVTVVDRQLRLRGFAARGELFAARPAGPSGGGKGAPELDTQPSGPGRPAADVWQLAACGLHWLGLEPGAAPRFAGLRPFPPLLRGLLEDMLATQPEKRPTIDAVLARLEPLRQPLRRLPLVWQAATADSATTLAAGARLAAASATHAHKDLRRLIPLSDLRVAPSARPLRQRVPRLAPRAVALVVGGLALATGCAAAWGALCLLQGLMLHALDAVLLSGVCGALAGGLSWFVLTDVAARHNGVLRPYSPAQLRRAASRLRL